MSERTPAARLRLAAPTGVSRARGIILMELAVALTVILVAIGVGITAWGRAVAGKAVHERRAAAREAVALSLERIRALDAALVLPAGQKADIGLPAQLARRLPGGRCELVVSPVSEARDLMRARVEVRWTGEKVPESGEIILRVPPAAEWKGARP
ncbi:MAG: hypothetical protein NTW87_33125 [Planctomycetota bacterium]|nr:hypothetical protein [Planctomycetota bacterium]